MKQEPLYSLQEFAALVKMPYSTLNGRQRIQSRADRLAKQDDCQRGTNYRI